MPDSIISESRKQKLIQQFAEEAWRKAGEPHGHDDEFWQAGVQELGHSERVLLHGVSGTGKSYAARRTNLKFKEKVYSVSLTDDTPAAELRGHYGLRGGEYEWMDGPCVMAWRKGGRLVLNELEKASGDAQTFLLGMLDDMEIAQQTLPTGETIKPIEGYHVVATMNGNPEDHLEPALRDRFPCCIEVDSVAPAALFRLPEEIQEAAKNTTIVDDPQRKISVRVWNEFVRLREIMGDDLAACCVFGARSKQALDHIKIIEPEKEPEEVEF
jgi:MoxR-like ATPase